MQLYCSQGRYSSYRSEEMPWGKLCAGLHDNLVLLCGNIELSSPIHKFWNSTAVVAKTKPASTEHLFPVKATREPRRDVWNIIIGPTECK